MRKLVYPAFFYLSFFFVSCGGGSEPAQKTYDYERSDSLPPQFSANLGNIRVSIEEMNVLNSLFKQEGHTFQGSIMNSHTKSNGYADAKSQAINIGIYGSDINYALAFEQNQEVMNLLKSIADLAKKLGIEKAFDEALVNKLVNAQDSTVDKSMLLTKAYRHAQDQLHNDERAALTALIVFGGWLEGIHIASSNLKEKPGSTAINQKVFEQLDTFNDVYEMLEIFKEKNKGCAEVLADINEISGAVTSLIRTKGQFSQEDINLLYNTIEGIRKKQI